MKRELLNKICVVCGVEFKCKTEGRKTCSAKCYRIFNPACNRTLHSFTCKVCGIEFKRADKRHGHFCSNKCANKNRIKFLKEVKKECVVCGEEYLVKISSAKRSIYCSEKCYDKKRRENTNRNNYHREYQRLNGHKYKGKYKSQLPAHLHEGWKCKVTYNTCKHCGIVFVSRQKRSFCSIKCDGWYRYINKNKDIFDNDRECRICGNVFKKEFGQTNSRYFCSKKCAKESDKQNRRDAKLNRDKRFKEQFKERIISKRVFIRDGMRCKICGKKLRMDKQVPHPLAPTIDHIIPLSKGGEHSYLNVRSAHFICNSLRGDRSTGKEQLMLFCI